jgi:hypothetical protein
MQASSISGAAARSIAWSPRHLVALMRLFSAGTSEAAICVLERAKPLRAHIHILTSLDLPSSPDSVVCSWERSLAFLHARRQLLLVARSS